LPKANSYEARLTFLTHCFVPFLEPASTIESGPTGWLLAARLATYLDELEIGLIALSVNLQLR